MDIPGPLNARIEQARRRIQSHRRWRAWLGYLVLVSTACLALAVVSRFVYVPHLAAVVAGAAAAGTLTAAVLARRARADSFRAAAELDLAEGLKERLSTLVEVSQKGSSGEVIDALLSDAQLAARDARPRSSLEFRAPRTLPVTLATGIAAIAVIFATPVFGPPRNPLSELQRRAAIRIHATANLLEDRGAPGELTDQFRRLGEALREGRTGAIDVGVQTIRASLDESREKAAQKDSALEAMRDSGPLRKLAELLGSNAPPDQVAGEASAVMEKSAPGAAAVLEEVLRRLTADSELREELRKALEAARERDKKAFAASMENISRKFANTPSTEDLNQASSRVESVARGGGAGKGTRPNGRAAGTPRAGNGQPGLTPIPVSRDTGLEEIMEKEKVPERFKDLIRIYFSRSSQEGRK